MTNDKIMAHTLCKKCIPKTAYIGLLIFCGPDLLTRFYHKQVDACFRCHANA